MCHCTQLLLVFMHLYFRTIMYIQNHYLRDTVGLQFYRYVSEPYNSGILTLGMCVFNMPSVKCLGTSEIQPGVECQIQFVEEYPEYSLAQEAIIIPCISFLLALHSRRDSMFTSSLTSYPYQNCKLDVYYFQQKHLKVQN